MSNTIRRYKSIEGDSNLIVTAFVGGDEYGKAIQFTIQDYSCDSYVQLSERQVIDLIMTLLKRLGLKPYYSATSSSSFEINESKIVLPDGTIVLEEEEE